MMKKILICLLFSFTLTAYCQGNIVIKLISYRVILKSGTENFYGDNINYYGNTTSEGIRYTMGDGKLDSLAKNAYNLALDGKIIVYDPFTVEVRGNDVRFLTIMS